MLLVYLSLKNNIKIIGQITVKRDETYLIVDALPKKALSPLTFVPLLAPKPNLYFFRNKADYYYQY